MLELLVAGLCIFGTECAKPTNAYMAENPEMQHRLDIYTKDVTDFVGQDKMAVGGFFYAAAVQKKGEIKISNHVKFDVGQNENTVILNWNY
jgi:hypothetical protein